MSEKRYGVWNLDEHRFVFNINESSKTRAMRELQRRIGTAAHNRKYVPRVIKENWRNPQNKKYTNYNQKETRRYESGRNRKQSNK